MVEVTEYKQSHQLVLRLAPVSDSVMRKHLQGLLQHFRVTIMQGL